MKILVTGGEGMLGRAVLDRFGRAHRAAGVDLADGDLSHPAAAAAICERHDPEWIVHCAAFRRNAFALADKVGGALAVGGVRNGGQELAIGGIQAALMCQEMIVVGDGRPTGHIGATLLNTDDSIAGDDFGLKTARNLGRRVAQVAMRTAGGAG